MTVLYHYTCDDGRLGIGDEGLLQPHIQLFFDWSVVWLTDLDVPMREPLGLTSHMLPCDRTRHRYRVTDTSTCAPWIRHAARTAEAVLALEMPSTMPMHWWVSEHPVPVVYDPIGVPA